MQVTGTFPQLQSGMGASRRKAASTTRSLAQDRTTPRQRRRQQLTAQAPNYKNAFSGMGDLIRNALRGK